MEFIALDVETANENFASICKIGFVHFQSGEVIKSYGQLIDPEDYFEDFNIGIHGISAEDVKGAPNFKKYAAELNKIILGKIVLTHTAFDRVSIHQACQKCRLDMPDCTWLDSAKVARRTWEDIRYRGYGLRNIADRLNIEFQHHDPVEDARAAGLILLRAIEETGISLEDWIVKTTKPILPKNITSKIAELAPNPDGDLFGETLVFTGAIVMPRREAAALAAKVGCTISDNVNMKTTILVVGNQDLERLNGQEKSSKHRKAEALIAGGQKLRIIGERDFLELARIQI